MESAVGYKFIVCAAVLVTVLLTLSAYFALSRRGRDVLEFSLMESFQAFTGRELKVDGKILFKLGLRPVVRLQGVRVQNASWGARPEMLRAKELELQFALLPLLAKELRLERLIFLEPDIFVETTASGKSNLSLQTDSLPPKAGTGPLAAENEAGLSVMWLRHLQIQKGLLTIKDGASGQVHSLALESLSLKASASSSPVTLAARGLYNHEPFEMEATSCPLTAAKVPHTPCRLNAAARVAGAQITMDGSLHELWSTKGISLQLKAEGSSINRVWKYVGRDVDVPDLGSFRAAADLVDHEGILELEGLVLEAGDGDVLHIGVTGGIKDLRTFRGMSLDLKVEGRDPSGIARQYGWQIPVKGSFMASGHVVDAGESSYRISEMRWVAKDMVLNGSLHADFNSARPKLSVVISANNLELDPELFLGKFSERGVFASDRDGEATQGQSVWPHIPLRLDVPNSVDVVIRIRSNQLLLGRTKIQDVSATVVLEEGTARVKPFRFQFLGGIVGGGIRLKPLGKGVALASAFRVEGLDIGAAAEKLQLKHPLTGKAHVEADLGTHGRSLAELIERLEGNITLSVRDGTVARDYLESIDKDLAARAAFSLLDILNRGTSSVQVDCFAGRFQVRDGIARSTVLAFDTPNMRVVGEGTANLGSGALAFSLQPDFKDTGSLNALIQAGLSLTEPAMQFKLIGTLEKPKLVMAPSRILAAMVESLGNGASQVPRGNWCSVLR